MNITILCPMVNTFIESHPAYYADLVEPDYTPRWTRAGRADGARGLTSQVHWFVRASWRSHSLDAAAVTVLPVRIDVGGTRTVLEDYPDNMALLFAGGIRARIAAAGVLHGEVQRRRAASVHQSRVRAALNEGEQPPPYTACVPLDGNGATPLSSRASGSAPAAVKCDDDAALRNRIPALRPGLPVRRVVERFRATPVARPYRRAAGTSISASPADSRRPRCAAAVSPA